MLSPGKEVCHVCFHLSSGCKKLSTKFFCPKAHLRDIFIYTDLDNAFQIPIAIRRKYEPKRGDSHNSRSSTVFFLVHVSIARVQVAHLRLFVLGEPDVCDRLRSPLVLDVDRYPVQDRGHGAYDCESEADRVALSEVRCVGVKEDVCSNDTTSEEADC